MKKDWRKFRHISVSQSFIKQQELSKHKVSDAFNCRDCGSECRGFESHQAPHRESLQIKGLRGFFVKRSKADFEQNIQF